MVLCVVCIILQSNILLGDLAYCSIRDPKTDVATRNLVTKATSFHIFVAIVLCTHAHTTDPLCVCVCVWCLCMSVWVSKNLQEKTLTQLLTVFFLDVVCCSWWWSWEAGCGEVVWLAELKTLVAELAPMLVTLSEDGWRQICPRGRPTTIGRYTTQH